MSGPLVFHIDEATCNVHLYLNHLSISFVEHVISSINTSSLCKLIRIFTVKINLITFK